MTPEDGDNEPDRYLPIGHEEPVRECPYCDSPHKSRGLFAHVLNTEGKGHGPRREVPDDFEVSDTKIVGYANVNKKAPVSESPSGNELILCKICGNMAHGMHGYSIHLNKMAGKKDHPEDPTDIADEQYRAIPADEHWNPVGPSVNRDLDEKYKNMIDWEQGNMDFESEKTDAGMFVPVEDMHDLRDMLIRSKQKQPVLNELERIIQRYS